MTGRNGNEPYAQVPSSVTESGLDHACVRLYNFVVQHSGPKGQEWVVKGASEIAKRINMQTKTLMTHARHLADYGLVSHDRDGMKMIEFHLLHCPPRGLFNADVQIPEIKAHARKTSRPPVQQKANHTSLENRITFHDDSDTKTEGQTKYAKKYGSSEEAFELHDWRSPYYQEGPKCALSGCKEFVRGHTFGHEPVLPEQDGNELVEGDDIDKLILTAFPGAQFVAESKLS